MSRQTLGKVMISNRGEYNQSTNYERLDLVSFNGSSFLCKKDCVNISTDNEEYWQLIASKGDTYQVSEEDIQTIANQIVEDANSGFNQNVAEKTTTFNSNAATKTTEFNNNATSKTDEFNTNVDTKTEDYDTNAAEKLNAYNTTAEEKTTAFNSNASSKKEEYDTNATSKTNDFNTNANTRLSEFNDNADSYDKRITDNSNRINRIETDLFDSGTASGKSINLKDSTLAEFKEINIDAVHKQETTYGKQLLDFFSISSTLHVTVEKDQNNDKITLSGDGETSYQRVDYQIPTGILKPNTKISFWCENSANENPNANPTIQIIESHNDGTPAKYSSVYNLKTKFNGSYILPSDISNISQVILGLYTDNSPSATVSANTISVTKPFLYFEEVDSPPDYEKFTGVQQSPSPDYPQPIKVIEEDFDLTSCGKNLWGGFQNSFSKTSSGITGVTNVDGTITINGASTNTYYSILGNEVLSNGIYVSLPKGTYTLWGGGTDYVLETIDANGKKIAQTTYTKHSVNFTLDEEMKLAVRVNIGSGNVFDNIIIKPQLEQGTVATDYEPYRETRTTITLPEGEFAGKINETTKDKFRLAFNEADGNYHLYLDKMLGKVVLDGSEKYVYEVPNNRFRYDNTKISKKKARQEIKSNYFCFSNEDKSGMAFSFGGGIYLYNYACETVDEFKNWLSTHNTEVYYLLETPYTLDLGVVDMPLSYYPVTNVYTTCELQPNIRVEYYRDFKGTVKAMQDDLTSASSKISTLESDVNTLKEQVAQLMTSATSEESEVVE